MLFGTYGVLPWGEAEPKATGYLEKALELDDTLPYAYGTRGFQLEHNRNWAEAEVALRHAIDLAPGDPISYCELGLLMVRTGRLEEALDRATDALGLDPISEYAHLVTMYAYLFSHRYDEAITWSLKMLEWYPEAWIGHWGLGYAYLGKGLHQEALETFEELVTLDSIRIGNLGYAYAVMGRREEALRVLDALKEPGAGHFNIRINIARIYTALGEREQALDWLEQNYRPLGYLKVDPTFDSLRSEPRFQALLKKMGLDP